MTDKEEYEKYVSPDIGALKERIRVAMIKGAENAKITSARKQKLIELRARKYRRQEIADDYGI